MSIDIDSQNQQIYRSLWRTRWTEVSNVSFNNLFLDLEFIIPRACMIEIFFIIQLQIT